MLKHEEWTIYAECSSVLNGAVPNMFPHDQNQEEIDAAKALCRACPVRTECLTAANARGERFGIWGGLTTSERAQLRREEREAARLVSTLPATVKPTGPSHVRGCRVETVSLAGETL